MHREEVVPLTPDPTPVKLSDNRCKVHNFAMISMPRDEKGADYGYVEKCPLRNCSEGHYKQ